jgi:hypothetical protein
LKTKNWRENTLKKIISIFIILLTLASACSSGDKEEEISSKEVKELVSTKLENRFKTEFKVKILSHDPVNDFYEIETYMEKNPDMTFFFTLDEKDLDEEDNPEGSKIDNIYRVVVSKLYKHDLKNIVNESLDEKLQGFQLKHLQIVTPDSVDLKEKEFSKMKFVEYSSKYKEETIYHLYFLVNENFNENYLTNHSQELKELFGNLETNNLLNLRVVMVFPNDLYLDSDITDINTLKTQPLQNVFSKEINKNPSIPGFNYEEWKESLE